MNTIITIGREYGSGGREIGRLVAAKLDVPFYDKEILTRAAQESGLCKEIFERHDEKASMSGMLTGSTSPVMHMGTATVGLQMPLNQRVFLAQFDAINRIASEGPCVIVGRCADYILETAGKEDLVKIFVYADIPTCVRRTQETDGITDTKEALNKLNKITKQRKSYHKYFTGKEWEDVTNYDLPINASKLELDQVVELIKDYIRMIGYDI